MTRLSALIAVLALFLAGVSIGALGMHLLDERPFVQGRGELDPRSTRGFVRWMEARLELTPDQRQRIARIRDESRRRAEEFRAEMRPRIELQMRETRDEINAVLTPEQRARLDEMARGDPRFMDRFLLGHRDRGPRRPRGPGGPGDPGGPGGPGGRPPQHAPWR